MTAGLHSLLSLQIQQVQFKLPIHKLAEVSEVFAGMFSLQEHHAPANKGLTEAQPLVMNWMYPGNWDYLIDAIFKNTEL